MRWTATVFARNEQAAIRGCVASVLRQGVVPLVLVNGSTDRTADRARDAGGVVVEIARGDKYDAWNRAVHQIHPAAEVHFFVDGYAAVADGSFCAMADTLALHPRANACAAMPSSGRSRAKMIDLVRDGLIHGSLFALSGHFVERIKQRQIYLPKGIYRGDGLIGDMALRDLDHTKPWDRSLVPCAEGATWTFRSLSPLRLEDWRRWLARRRNQQRGRTENARLAQIIKSQGYDRLPEALA